MEGVVGHCTFRRSTVVLLPFCFGNPLHRVKGGVKDWWSSWGWGLIGAPFHTFFFRVKDRELEGPEGDMR